FFQAEDGIRDSSVTGVQTCALPIFWVFTHWFEGMFSSLLWLMAGFMFLPTTVLWYTAVQHWFGGHWTLWPLVGIIAALAIDLVQIGRASCRERGEVRGVRGRVKSNG